ncbi:MAG TPA: helix-turn-helix domain-containing protein [Methanocorpusculum sp.]|nr:helix-turn-helix domain-containing protein [Methanocorpusculum sp.]
MAAKTQKKTQKELLNLFSSLTNKTKIVEERSTLHGTLRDQEAVEREIALIMHEIKDRGIFKTSLEPIQLARIINMYYAGKNDTEIARSLGDEKLSKTISRARIQLKLFRDNDFKMPFKESELRNLQKKGMTQKDIAQKLGISPTSLREYSNILDMRDNTALNPYLERIQDVLHDRDLTEKMASTLQEDTLGEAIDVAESVDMSEIN